ncbi:MAG: hypothetical protein IIB57_03105 [Planctomycetes bacterium]|nr:hypothetical protein [Planctomycetota bacterium]
MKAVLNGSAAALDRAAPQADFAEAATTSNGKRKRPAVAVVAVIIFVAMAGAGYTFWPRNDGPQPTELTANAGVDQAIRSDSTLTLVGATTNSTACEWTTDGDGSFDDATLLAAVYTPKKGDSSDRSVTLTLTCSNASGQEATDSMVVTINTAPPPDEPPSADAAIQEIRDLLSVWPYLEDALVFELVTRKDVAIVNGVATVNYRVPGLQLYERSIPLDAGDDTLSIGIDGKKLVGEARAELTALLENDPPEHFRETVGRVITEQLGPFLTTDAVSISDFVPTWKLDESHTFWVAQGETATITIKNTEPAAVSGLSFTARDGFVSLVPNGDLDEAIVSAVNGAVAAIQRNAVDDWLSGLEDLGVPPEAVEYPEIGADPRTQIQVDYSAPTLQTRKYSPEWNRDSLTFEPPDWKESAGPFARALATINALNDVDQRPAWVGQIRSIGMFREGEGSTANELHVVTTAPGADDAEDVPVELDFRFPLDSTDTDIPMPRSWPLVVRYLDLIDHPMIVGPADPAIPSSTLWTELPEELTPLVNARLAAIQLDAAFQGKPRLIDDDLPQLDTQIVLSWRRSRSYEDMSAHAVTAGLDVLTGEKALLYKLSLRLDEQGDVTMKWEGYADNEDGVSQLDAITGYDRLLREYSDRLLLEAKLARLLSSGSFAPLEPDQAVQFLIEIWNIKAPEAAPAAPQDLDSLTNTIRRQRGFSKKGRAREHDSPKPTIFGEYFCGPQSTFAIVWSTTETNSLVEGPTLVQLAATSDLIAGADVGALLLDPVFDRVPEAVEPALPKNFKDAVGIILALDAPLELLAKDPADLKLHMRNSVLRECDPIKRAASAPVPWDSLRVLREESPTKRSDFKFVRSLIPPNETWQRETDPDLIEAAFRCRAAFRAAVTAEQSPRD